ncbi:MAG: hypothetical protein HQM03_04210 [Magnetococcales bacterium]|nr:hypothetical protein [Magnetococcales bacterium]
MKRFLGGLVLTWCVMAWAAPVLADSGGRLVVFTTDYCPYCKDFMEHVAPAYPKTSLGKRFPMTMVDNFSPPKEWEEMAWQIRFYPTFLVVDRQGKTRGQFRGYRGEEFFWSELEGIASRVPDSH